VTIQRYDLNGKRLSQVLVHNGVAYVAGQTATDRTKDVSAQTAEVLAKIDGLLAKAGSDKSRILFAQVWLKHVVKGFCCAEFRLGGLDSFRCVTGACHGGSQSRS
jgi:enamine deaminase RidA (YjgF/YER057c/UK114 family)